MTDTIKFQCDLDTTNPLIPLGFEVLLDGKNMFKTEHVVGPCQVAFDIIDDDANHRLQNLVRYLLISMMKTVQHKNCNLS